MSFHPQANYLVESLRVKSWALLFLLYVNDMPQAVNCALLLYADDTCRICTGKHIKTIEDQLNKDFNPLCEWFIDDKLSIHFGEEKTESILLGTIKRLKNSRNLDMQYKDIKIKQHAKVTHLGCILDSNLSREAMATKVLGTINRRLKFLYRKPKFLSFSLRRLLCNALIQPHFDYACAARYPKLNKLFVCNLTFTCCGRDWKVCIIRMCMWKTCFWRTYEYRIPVVVIKLSLS